MCPAETSLWSVAQDLLQQAGERPEHSAPCVLLTLKQGEIMEAVVLGTIVFLYHRPVSLVLLIID